MQSKHITFYKNSNTFVPNQPGARQATFTKENWQLSFKRNYMAN